MNNLSWADIAVDKDYNYATTEVFHYIHSIEIDGASPAALACALLERAQETMNYQDPWDGMVDDQWQHDREFVQINRLMNFMDTIAEFADKRLALIHTGDRYMEQKMADYKRAKSQKPATMIGGIKAEPKEIEYELILDLITDLEQDLITQGISRTTLAKTLVDCAFVYAKQQPTDHYIKFCCDLKIVLGRDVDMSEMLDMEDDLFDAELTLMETASTQGSTLIH